MTTIQITDTEDTYIDFINSFSNYGGSDPLRVGKLAADLPLKALIRLNRALIPEETLTAFRFYFYAIPNASEANHPEVYIIKDANDWVEGTDFGGQQVGSCCWEASKLEVTAWAGAAGCSASGTDYDADADPPTCIITPGSGAGYVHIDLPVAWATAWRDETRVNNGLLLTDSLLASENWNLASSEAAELSPYFEIDYGSSGPPAAIYRARRKGRFKLF